MQKKEKGFLFDFVASVDNYMNYRTHVFAPDHHIVTS